MQNALDQIRIIFNRCRLLFDHSVFFFGYEISNTMVRGGKRKLVNDDNLRPNKISYNNAKLIAVVQAPIKGRELTSFTFVLDHSHQLMTSMSLCKFRIHTAILRAVNTSKSGSCSALCDTGEGKLIA